MDIFNQALQGGKTLDKNVVMQEILKVLMIFVKDSLFVLAAFLKTQSFKLSF